MLEYVVSSLVMLIILLNMIWLERITLGKTGSSQQPLQKTMWTIYFSLAPVLLVLIFLNLQLTYLAIFGFGLMSIWFSTSRMRYVYRGFDIPFEAYPISIIYFMVAVGLCISAIVIILNQII